MTKSTMRNSRIFKCALFPTSSQKHDRSGSSVPWISASDYLKMRFAFKGFANFEVLHLKWGTPRHMCLIFPVWLLTYWAVTTMLY